MIDLHTHSTASDGSCTPQRLIELALGNGLTALALTDHDTLDGVEAARTRSAGTGLNFYAGVEIEIDRESSSAGKGAETKGEFHLLGLGLTEHREELEAALKKLREARHDRNLRMVDKLQRDGIPVSMDELNVIAGGKVVSRAHFARLFIQKRVVSSVEEAFSRMIGKGQAYYEPRACLTLSEATDLIHRAGGIAVVAHPVSLALKGPALRQFLSSCKDEGVDGLEAWHPNHALKDCRRFERMANDLALLVTGGSDFHGEHMPQRRLGYRAVGAAIPDELLDALPLPRNAG
ncbi:MAG TPA: PHP domain-containing protein [Spirochaetia bacterium]|nr:PHP domain-containing protein [Spirochaetia bacterium]